MVEEELDEIQYLEDKLNCKSEEIEKLTRKLEIQSKVIMDLKMQNNQKSENDNPTTEWESIDYEIKSIKS